MRYIQEIKRPSELTEGSEVFFTFDNGYILQGRVTKNVFRERGYYINISGHNNCEIFDCLCLDRFAFVHSIVGYTLRGDWPEVRTLEDLSKVLDALLNVSKPEDIEAIEEIKEVEETPTPTSEWDWLLS